MQHVDDGVLFPRHYFKPEPNKERLDFWDPFAVSDKERDNVVELNAINEPNTISDSQPNANNVCFSAPHSKPEQNPECFTYPYTFPVSDAIGDT